MARTCKTCGNPEDDHPFRHPFDADGTGPNPFKKDRRKEGQGASTDGPSVSMAQASMPFDPVLRQALINRGVITPQDLVDAETMIRTVTGLALGGLPQDMKEGT